MEGAAVGHSPLPVDGEGPVAGTEKQATASAVRPFRKFDRRTRLGLVFPVAINSSENGREKVSPFMV
jgi:hypothetical protein